MKLKIPEHSILSNIYKKINKYKMTTHTKTKRSIILSILAMAFMFTSAISFAAYDASSESSNCDGTDCRTWHNNGITHSQYEFGTDFPTFNNYRDAKTRGTPRYYEEMQFLYISTTGASDIPWNSSSNFNFSNGINHNLTFNGNNPQTIGFWVYMHNNGEGDLASATAEGTKVRMSNWSSSSPRTSYSPKATISADNTKPRSIWANVGLTGNVPFTLTPTDLYIYREDGTSPSLAGAQLQSLTTTGLTIRNSANENHGVFKSSDRHIVYLYVEFQAVPEDIPGNCHSLTITDPSQTLLNVDENGFNDENLSFTVDTDPNVVTGYQISSSNGTITFDNSGSSNIQRNKTQMVMDGGPDGQPQTTDTVRVWALDENNNAIQACMDSFQVRLEQEENDCAVLETTPPPSPVPLDEWTTITVDELLDTNGDLYTDEGAPAQIEYCYSNNDITFDPEPGLIWVQTSDRCIVAQYSENYNVRVYPTSPGTMAMNVAGTSPEVCYTEFETEGEGKMCISLDINQNEFTGDDSTYSVNVNSDGLPYDVNWTIQNTNGDTVFDEDTNGNSIDLDDYSYYNFTPGDTLIARATNIYDPEDNCLANLVSDEKECTFLTIDPDDFERGQNNEICVDDTDWPLDEGDELEYSIDGGSTQSEELDEDLCFIIRENEVEDADYIEVWVPEWKDECNDDLDVTVEPPEFDKNAKSQESAAYSNRTVSNFSDDYVNYEITYMHFADEDIDVTITDTIGDGYIQGYIADSVADIGSAEEGGRIYYDEGSMVVYVDGDRIEDCDDTEDDICYEGSIGDPNGVEVMNVPDREEVRIEYRGEIDSTVNPESCSDPEGDLWESGVCGEIYPNTAEFEDELGFDDESDAEVLIPCPFIIIRAGGDVFLENPFDYGVDTLSCAEISTSDTPVIQGNPPEGPDAPSTGGGDASVIAKYSDRLCNSNEGTDIEGISSLICELELTSEDLTQQAIVQSLSRNVTLFSRYADNLRNTSVINGSSTLDNINSANEVYVKNNGDLTLGGEFADRARTIVVLNNDLYINRNITFKDPATLNDPRQVPSLAVIVIGGDIIIDPTVSETNAIFFVQEGEDGGGQICEGPACGDVAGKTYNTANSLTHYGSIYGDIEDLIKYRVKTGDPTKEEGAILIRFDNRVYLNTPPLLNKLVDVTQSAF